LISKESLAFRLSSQLEAFCYRKAWLVTGQSKSILANITERFPTCRTFHLSNGVDTQRFVPDQQAKAARAMFTSNGDCVALYAGLHGLAQGLDQILSAAEILHNEAGFKFVLVGDGPEKKALMERAKQRGLTNVRFFDSRPAKEIPSLLAASDVALITLKTDLPGAVPSKIYEAMASARPIVLVANGEAAEIVRGYDAGLTVEPGDVQGLVQGLRKLSAEPGLRRMLGENGRQAAEQHFDRAKIATRFIDYLEENS
jgi:colanic acid biosynthesis glycosyl transferase WcaI